MILELILAAAVYGAPDINDWYAGLKQPDHPSVSCCGWADAYYADRVDECGPKDAADCALVAIITDTRPDTLTLPDGRVLNRPHMPPGVRVSIPASKIRKVPSENPTDHNIVFVAQNGYVFCWEPAAGI